LELEGKGVLLAQGGLSLVEAACAALKVKLKQVNPALPLLQGADATINVARKWALVRNDVDDEMKAFLVAHELGHLRLHPATIGTVEVSQAALTGEGDTNGVKEVESYGARERQELQANVFAREFLLPRSLARTDFVELKQSATTISANRKLPIELVRLQLYDGVLLPDVSAPTKVFRLPDRPTRAQEPAVDSNARVSLVEAGPGTGKTTTLLLRLRRLIAKGVAPENIVILTFSNKAARELVERARAGGIVGADKVWIGTFHAFGLEFLRKFGNLHGLEAAFPVLDKLAVLAMLEADLPSLELGVFDPLSNPSPWLESAVDTIRRAKDETLNAAQLSQAVSEASGTDQELDGKRRDVATIFERYELLLQRRKAVDLNDLLCVAIRLMQTDDVNVAHFLRGIHHLMVDEYQDVNRASALLVKELNREAEKLWVVGDANQAIYAFMGASSSNLENIQSDFPGAVAIPLAMNHRSSQEIVNAFCEVAKRNPAGRTTRGLEAERKYMGHGPRLVETASDGEQLEALAWRIRQLQREGTPRGEQAIIVFRNAVAAEIAAGLEIRGIPVLYLGNIFERPEVKDLICLLQLAVDSYGVNLVRQWNSPCLALSRRGADAVFSQTRAEERGWREVSVSGLSERDACALGTLRRLCALVTDNMSPWTAMSELLLEDGEWVRELASQTGQAAANARMAVWQFVHFCRSPDGTGRWATVRSLPQRIRDRVRLGEDRSMRAVPPEAEGMDAVRVLTAHGSKGLEFDAVHFLGVTKNAYETPRSNANPLLPESVLGNVKAQDSLKNERHNLLYVAVSRPRLYLTVYSLTGKDLPSALQGLLTPLQGDWHVPPIAGEPPATAVEHADVSLEEYLQFVKCPQRHEISSRAGGRSQREELKLYRAVDVATRRAMKALAEDATLLADDQWIKVVDKALSDFGLDKQPALETIRARVAKRVAHGRSLLSQGGATDLEVSMDLGPMRVRLAPDQVFQQCGERRLRFIRTSASSFKSMKQPLAALLDAHNRSGGAKTVIEIATLSDEQTQSVGTVRAPTPARFQGIANELCAKHFPAEPDGETTCHFCAYMFPCAKRSGD
jgi:superfamily I DNA/RNA helicase